MMGTGAAAYPAAENNGRRLSIATGPSALDPITKVLATGQVLADES
jgi:hypothetical protein